MRRATGARMRASLASRREEPLPYAARTPARKVLTSPDSCSACLERLEAAVRTRPAAPPVSLAAALTPPILVVTSWVACAVWVTLRAISAVAAPCSSIAEPIVVGDRADFLDRGGDALDGLDGFLGRALDLGDAGADLLGGLRGLAGEALHFGRDHGKAPAGLAGAGGFDGGVERQQIGLSGDARNQFRDMLDLLGAVGQRPHGGVGAARVSTARPVIAADCAT